MKNTKSKTTTALLAFFLGVIGGHKFYLGNVKVGLLYLLFSWTFIPAIVSFFEACKYLSQSNESFQNELNQQVSKSRFSFGQAFGGLIIGLLGLGLIKIATAPKAPHEVERLPANAQFIAESCHELSRTFGSSSKLTELQKNELWKKYKNKYFKWNLKVSSVDSTFGQYTVQFQCRNSSSLFVDIHLEYDDSKKPQLLKFQKNKFYQIQGRLNHHSTLLGLRGVAL